VPAEALEQTVVEPAVEATPAPVADAPDSAAPEAQVDDATTAGDAGKEGES
jgi:hypothetical protein